MTAAGRAMLGAIVGAGLTLAAHPASRTFIVMALTRASAPQVGRYAEIRPAVLPPPSNPIAASIWLQTAAEKLQHRASLSRKEVDTLLSLTDEASSAQPENAYWPQMKAVLLAYAGNGEKAREEWIRASRCQTWDDLQTRRLLADRARLVKYGGWNQAWTYGYMFFARSDAAASQVMRYAQALVSHTTVDDGEGLKIRYSTIRNGSLLRDGSRSIRVGRFGSAMIELATYPPPMSDTPNPRRLWIAQTTLTSKLKETRSIDEAMRANQAFGKNDAWLALTESESPEENNRTFCLTSIAVASLPGSLALGSAIGLAILLIGNFAQRTLSRIRFFSPFPVVVSALVAAAIVFGITKSWVACVSVATSVCFLIVGPSNPRVRRSEDLGPFYQFTLMFLWFVSGLFFSLYLLSTSTAALALLPSLGPAGEYLSDSASFLAVAIIVLFLTCLVAPSWAVVRRYGTPDILGLTLRRFGLIAAIGGLCLCVISGPLSIYADRRCSSELSQILENEPIYYLNQ
ncbi:MAG TPA: hypothetical protein VG944_07615 [Fimbriimonas sp.]|nr:hypothetical protein [Fimbriimonas sp.]